MYNFSSKLWYNKRSRLSNNEFSIYLQVVINREHDEFHQKLRWPEKYIDLEKDILLPRYKGDPDVDDYNLLVFMEKAKHTEILRTYRIKKAPLDMKRFNKELRIFDQRESFIAYMLRTALSRYGKKEIEKRTWQNHFSAVSLMREFDDAWRYENLSLSWMKKFKVFLQTKTDAVTEETYEPGYVWTVLKNVKSYLKLATKEPMVYVDPEVAAFSNPEPEWDTDYLTKEELRRMMVLLKNGALHPTDEQVLRAFLFTCFTSLRISDVYRVNSNWVINDGFLDFIPKKNQKKKRTLRIPIMPMAYHVVQHESGKYFELPSEGKYNERLKYLAGIAQINKNLHSHMGRHTFGHLYSITVGNLKGLQEILGHKKITTTMRYAHLDDDYKTASVKLIQDKFSDMVMWAV